MKQCKNVLMRMEQAKSTSRSRRRAKRALLTGSPATPGPGSTLYAPGRGSELYMFKSSARKRHGKVRAECNAPCNQCGVVRNDDTRTKSRLDKTERSFLLQSMRVQRTLDGRISRQSCWEQKSGNFFFGNSTCKVAKASQGKAHTRMKRATAAQAILQALTAQRPFDLSFEFGAINMTTTTTTTV